MADFSINYEDLYDMRDGMHQLAKRAADGGGDGKFAEMGNNNPGDNTAIFGNSYLSQQFSVFFRMCRTRTEKASEKLEQFGDTFGGVADAVFQQDAQIASGAASASAKAEFNRWRGEVERHENWVEATEEWNAYLEEIGAAEYFAEHPGAQMGEVCKEDDRPAFCDTWEQDVSDLNAPHQPGEEPPVPDENPPSRMRFTNPDGSTTEITLSYDENYTITSETTTTTLEDGQEFVSTTEYTYGDDGQVTQEDVTVTLPDGGEMTTVTEYSGELNEDVGFDNRDYTSTTNGPDESTTVEEVTIDDETGAGTKTVTTTEVDDDGNEEVTVEEYTRPGPTDDWEPVEK
ncbi:hotdog family protein [Streptomyces marincola]|uniref:hypothetical protein n=1 Tax=Streptomyces marincola TaxID=2878388 RepID=UPI001CF21BCA|nr:hypothetical protein [Streptomyces marincola]UCM90410.1 hypothetical protein LC193_22130 [Streptomyces marincola]